MKFKVSERKLDLVSVVITTKNEDRTIERLIISLYNQTYKRLEIVLVDNNSTDKTVNKAKALGVRVYNFGPERSAQRNYGAKKAKGKYLFFLDADMEVSPKVVEDCVNVFRRSKNIGGINIPEESIGKNFWERVKAFERSFYNQEGDNTTDAARFFMRGVFLQVGGYDETITGPEDWDLPASMVNLGYKIGRAESIIYHHEIIPSLSSLVKKKFYYALKSYRYLAKQQIPIVSPKTIYFLRPIFYRNWKKLISNPALTLGMFIMLSSELLAGGLGYLYGRVKNK